MSIILSLSKNHAGLWAAGPDGLFAWQDGGLVQTPQPQQNLYCCCAIHDRLLVGGLPHGVAFRFEGSDEWQAGWMDNVEAPVVTIAADPLVEFSGVLLAGTDGGGILRTVNRGGHWFSRNYGLRSYSVLSVVWAPPSPVNVWPHWQMVFAATEEGVYHSLNGGRGWKRSETPEAVYQTLAVAHDYHHSRLVLAGTESHGLMRSQDGGYSFAPVPGAPEQINALVSTTQGWFLSDAEQTWHSPDGLVWKPLGLAPALVLLADGDGAWAGTEDGVTRVSLTPEPAAA